MGICRRVILIALPLPLIPGCGAFNIASSAGEPCSTQTGCVPANAKLTDETILGRRLTTTFDKSIRASTDNFFARGRVDPNDPYLRQIVERFVEPGQAMLAQLVGGGLEMAWQQDASRRTVQVTLEQKNWVSAPVESPIFQRMRPTMEAPTSTYLESRTADDTSNSRDDKANDGKNSDGTTKKAKTAKEGVLTQPVISARWKARCTVDIIVRSDRSITYTIWLYFRVQQKRAHVDHYIPVMSSYSDSAELRQMDARLFDNLRNIYVRYFESEYGLKVIEHKEAQQ